MKQKHLNRALPRAAVLGCALLMSVPLLRASPQGSSIEVISPSHPETFDVCNCPKVSQRLSWDDKAGVLKGIIQYSTVMGADVQPADSKHLRTYVVAFPTVNRSANNDLYVESNNRKVALGHLKKNAPGHRVRVNSGVNFVAHRVEGRIGGEIIVSPAASTVVIH